MYNRKKTKVCRRFGERLFSEVKVSDDKLAVPPGKQPGRRRRGGVSEYGRQLQEKQKLKHVYGLREKQFRNTYEQALKSDEPAPIAFLKRLERRLDNIVYRGYMAKSRDHARQIVSHGHIFVNGKKVTIPSYMVAQGDVVSFADKQTANIQQAKEVMKEAESNGWLSIDQKKHTVSMTHDPGVEELIQMFDVSLVVQFYSR